MADVGHVIHILHSWKWRPSPMAFQTSCQLPTTKSPVSLFLNSCHY